VGLVQHHVRGPATLGVGRLDVAHALRVGVAVRVLRPAVFRVPFGESVAVRVAHAHPAPVDVERPRAVLEDSRGDGADEGLAGDDDRLERGLERRAPALPAFGVRGGGGRASEGPHAHNLPLHSGRLVDGLGHVERLREPAVPGGEDQPIASGDERAVRDGDAPHHSGIVHDVCRDAGRRQEAPSSIFPHS
jgi:hypothetical protein